MSAALGDRSTYIGGSDLMHVLNCPPYGCELKLWKIKRGEFAEDLSANHHIQRGTAMEPLIAELYAEKYGRRVRRIAVVKDEAAPWRLAHPDYHIVAFDDRGPGLLSIKCPSLFVFKQMRREGIGEGYIAQLQYELGLKGWTWGSYGIFSPEAWEFLTEEPFDVQFDRVMYDGILRKVDEFQAKVENGPKPEPLPSNSKQCRRCPLRWECHAEMLEDLPEFDGVPQQDDSLVPLISEYEEAQEIEADAKAHKESVGAKVKAALGDRQLVECGGKKVYYAWTKRKAYTVAEGRYRALRIY